MNRRSFLAAAATTATAPALLAEGNTAVREYLSIRTYFAAEAGKVEKLVEKLDAAIPFVNGLGFGKVGVFSVRHDLHEGDKKFPEMYRNVALMVLSTPDFGKLECLQETLQTSPDAPLVQTGTADMLYENEQITLLRAFPGWPEIQVPNLSPERVIQLRCYASPTPERNRMKRNMFDVRGELALFRRCGMEPVLYGETLFGGFLAPSLHYMLSFENNDARLAGWKKFVTSNEWKQMSGEAAFRDTATRIINLFLKPSAHSQI
ncbi:MAG: NIPSNAP family protein [Planctomycetia bacterium]|nr:NIPSNAP family protein [Planctomycetia bacterium]